MPRKNAVPVDINVAAIQQADEWLITSIIGVSHFANSMNSDVDGNQTPNTNGNVDVGDTLITNDDGSYAKEEKFCVHYLVLLDGVVVDKDSQEITGDDLITLLSVNNTAREAMKQAGYNALEQMGITPVSSKIS